MPVASGARALVERSGLGSPGGGSSRRTGGTGRDSDGIKDKDPNGDALVKPVVDLPPLPPSVLTGEQAVVRANSEPSRGTPSRRRAPTPTALAFGLGSAVTTKTLLGT